MRIRIISALVLFAAFLGSNQAFPAVTPGHSKAIAANLHLSDAQLEGVIRAKLAKSKMASEGFTVHVHNRVATWEGKTGVIQHKGAATRMSHTAGVPQVVNNIRITEEARQRAAAQFAKRHNGDQPIKKATLIQ